MLKPEKDFGICANYVYGKYEIVREMDKFSRKNILLFGEKINKIFISNYTPK